MQLHHLRLEMMDCISDCILDLMESMLDSMASTKEMLVNKMDLLGSRTGKSASTKDLLASSNLDSLEICFCFRSSLMASLVNTKARWDYMTGLLDCMTARLANN